MCATTAWPDSVCMSPRSKTTAGCPVAVVLPSVTWLAIGVTAHVHAAHNRLIIPSPRTYSSLSCFGPHGLIRSSRGSEIHPVHPFSTSLPPPPNRLWYCNINEQLFCLDLISCNCKVMKYLPFGSAELCRFKVSGALTASLGGKNGSGVAGAKASDDKSEARDSMSGLRVHVGNKIFIVSDNQLR